MRGLAVCCALIVVGWSPVFGTSSRAVLYQAGECAEFLVVWITGPATEGAGILFHVDERYAYVLTARHVVFQQGRLIEGLTVRLRVWPEAQLHVDRESYRLHLQEDLAVFRVDLRPLGLSPQEILQRIPLDQLGASDGLDPGDTLASLGHSTAGTWISPKAPIRFARSEGEVAFLFEYDCPPGHSGGAVFDEQWRLVGMMIQEARPYCRALRIEAILRIIQGWKLSIGLRKPPPSEGEETLPERLAVAVASFDNRSTKRLPDLGLTAQVMIISHLHTLPGIALVTKERLESVGSRGLFVADVLVTGSIMRYDVERRIFEGFGTKTCKDIFRMTINLQILDVSTGRVRFSKDFGMERTRQYPRTAAAPTQPIDLTSELLEALLAQARNDIRSALAQVAAGLETVGGFLDVPVRSTPAGAEVRVGGIYIGRTPTTLQLTSESTHEVEIVLGGHETWRRRVRGQPGMNIEARLVTVRH